MRTLILTVVLGALTAHPAFAQADKPPRKSYNCATQPITKDFGGSSWLVHSCDDVALFLVSAPDSPASFSYFAIYPSEDEPGRYSIEGEGVGGKQASDAALAEIRLLSPSEIAALIAEVKRRQPK
ncbi:MAG: hypothetical protein FJX11_22810 [Alphaproteobacteria bacterium]|nr:hypothetical protein [Alphaproteobacteria bacterium]